MAGQGSPGEGLVSINLSLQEQGNISRQGWATELGGLGQIMT